ncbi:hypothetical protein JHD46_00590 [Sulfurimonas sp. SAG-AH-194-C20]|nr:hypothetical protein [Sulfurimonas sp. SAG-AH-194-C20]MDF1878129.1 hypothetical protein [Sulfurimonas sp. SAG-AH-194-C20]
MKKAPLQQQVNFIILIQELELLIEAYKQIYLTFLHTKTINIYQFYICPCGTNTTNALVPQGHKKRWSVLTHEKYD